MLIFGNWTSHLKYPLRSVSPGSAGDTGCSSVPIEHRPNTQAISYADPYPKNHSLTLYRPRQAKSGVVPSYALTSTVAQKYLN